MNPRSFLCEEAKNKQRTSLKKELYEIGEEAIWESRFTSFFFKCYPRIEKQSIKRNLYITYCTYLIRIQTSLSLFSLSQNFLR